MRTMSETAVMHYSFPGFEHNCKSDQDYKCRPQVMCKIEFRHVFPCHECQSDSNREQPSCTSEPSFDSHHYTNCNYQHLPGKYPLRYLCAHLTGQEQSTCSCNK